MRLAVPKYKCGIVVINQELKFRGSFVFSGLTNSKLNTFFLNQIPPVSDVEMLNAPDRYHLQVRISYQPLFRHLGVT
jgi:hypothetical protein